MPEAAIVFTLDGTILKANPAAVKLFEAHEDELIGRSIYSLGVMEAEKAQDVVARLSRGTTIRVEMDFLTIKGNRRKLDILHIPLLTRTGEVEQVLGFGRDVTEQRNAEREQALLAALVKTSDDAIISLSADFRIMSWNQGAQKLLGYTEAEVLGQRPFDLYVPPADRAKAEAVLAADLSSTTESPSMLRPQEASLLRKDGTMVDVTMVACGIWDSAGKLLGLSTILRDVSERKRAANEQLKLATIQDEQASLATIVNASQDAIIGYSKEIKITVWNPAAEKLYGFTAKEAIGHGFDLFVPPEELGPALEADRRVLDTGEAVTFQQRAQKKDGTWFVSLVNIFPIRDATGKIIGGAGIGRDITDLLKLQREEALYAAIVNASQDAIMNVSPEAKIVSWNPAAEKTYGYTAKEAIGQGIELFVPPAELPQTMATTRRVVETGQSASWEQHARRRDGTSFISAVNIFPIRDATGNVTGVAGIGRDITRLKDVEKELREARDYTRGLIESSVDAMVVVDREMWITDGNEQLAKLTEVPKKMLIGSRFDSYFSEPAHATAAIAKTLADGWVTNYDLVLRAASGKEILIAFNASVFSRAGLVSGIFGVARDVTERRTTEHKLAEEQHYSRSLVESSPDALLVSNSELILTDVNGQTARFTGYRREELVGIQLASFFTEPEKAIDVVRRALAVGFVQEAELCLLTKTAEAIPVSLSASVFKNADGSARGVIIGLRDISERKRAEKERSLLASIVDSSGDAIYSESTDLIVTSWNAAAERLFGYSAAEIVGRNVALLVPLDGRAKLLQDLTLVSQTGKAERYETMRQRKDGSSIAVALTRAPILDPAHTVVGFSVTAHDIGERRRIEAELTAARDAALEAARAKSEFLANMSHEIRTPLNSVIGITGLLLDTHLTPEQSEFAHDVRESGEALLTLINEILDFSKLAAGKMVFEEIDFELTAAVDGAVELLAEQARRKGLELTVAIDPEAPQGLRGDPSRLRQVLLNLIGNAIKFTARGEIAVQVNKLSENQKETVLRFEVRDTGIGIAQEKLHLLFQPFSQVDASTTRHFGGTGLGLSIARELLARFGGTIAVSSNLGSGSTFWFTAKFARPSDAMKPPAERFRSFTGARVLIVDDNANSLQILQSRVSGWQMAATTADSAEAALKLMRAAGPQQPFQVALIDVGMPEVDGVELARRIKSDPALAATAIILISSGGSRNEFSARLRGLEVCEWLMKPAPESALHNALRKALAPVRTIGPDSDVAQSAGSAKEPARSGKLKLPVDRKIRVLLAEDNPINRKVAKLQLTKLGVEVDCVGNGLEALEAVLRRAYDAVLMDCQMPEMDGYQASREIRRREGSQRHTPIIALTANALAGDGEACLAAGMDAYISKPAKPEILEGILAQVLAHESERVVPSDAPGASEPQATTVPPRPQTPH